MPRRCASDRRRWRRPPTAARSHATAGANGKPHDGGGRCSPLARSRPPPRQAANTRRRRCCEVRGLTQALSGARRRAAAHARPGSCRGRHVSVRLARRRNPRPGGRIRLRQEHGGQNPAATARTHRRRHFRFEGRDITKHETRRIAAAATRHPNRACKIRSNLSTPATRWARFWRSRSSFIGLGTRRRNAGPGVFPICWPARGLETPNAANRFPARVFRRPAAAHRHRPRHRPAAPSSSFATRRCPRWTFPSNRRSSTCCFALQREMHLALIFIAHDLAVVKHVSDHIAVMYLGEVVEIRQRRARPSTPRPGIRTRRRSISAIPVPDPSVRQTRAPSCCAATFPRPSAAAKRLPLPHPLPPRPERLQDREAQADPDERRRRRLPPLASTGRLSPKLGVRHLHAWAKALAADIVNDAVNDLTGEKGR